MNSAPERGRAFLEIRSISHFYGKTQALQNVSLQTQKSEVLALLGPSGSGKSTLLSVIAGIAKPTAGQILINGRDLLQFPAEARGLGMVFQDFALWPHMTVAQNVAFPLRVRHFAAKIIEERTKEVLNRVGLEGFAGRRPHELSGGQQQRVALARAVIAETQLLLLDEPLSALDPATRSNVRSELAKILRKLNLTTIIVTHDREEAFELADRIAVLIDGKIQQHGTPEDVYERPANALIAGFMGVNLLAVRLRSDGRAELKGNPPRRLELPYRAGEGPGYLVIVPEKTRVADNRFSRSNSNVLQAKLLGVQYRGGEYRVQVRVGEPEDGQVIEARSTVSPRGDWLFVHLPSDALHVIKQMPFPTIIPAPINPKVTDTHSTKRKEEIA
jgi:ABC-type Fe3+/spermidine/putrescine transport system ATPase subunit